MLLSLQLSLLGGVILVTLLCLALDWGPAHRPASELILAVLPLLALGVICSLLLSLNGSPLVEWFLPVLAVLVVGWGCRSGRLFRAVRWGAFAVALVLCGSFLHLVKTDFTAAPQRTLGLRRLISRGQVDAAAKALQKAFPPDSTFPEAPVGQLLGNPNYGEVEVVTAERHWYTPISRLYRVRRDKAVIWYPGGKVQEASRHLELRPKAEAAKA